jgi:RNA polymerase sigma-70 factor (ECF subfamily)
MSYTLSATAGHWQPEWMWNSDTHTSASPSHVDAYVEAARLGDDRAFGNLIEFYRATAERVAQQILYTEDAAADAVQESLIKAHRAMARFQDGNFRSWFLRIVTNTCYDHLRRQKRRAAASLDELAEMGSLDAMAPTAATSEDPESVALQNEGMSLLLRAIDALPVWHRSVVMLVDVQGYDYGEAAQILNLPLGTVKSRLSRARAALRDELVRTGVVPGRMF